jgi:hypothetical protein
MALNSNVYGWSVSGTVKNSSGSGLSGVTITVKDSSKYSTTTSADGSFKLESTATSVMDVIKTGNATKYSIQITGKNLQIRSTNLGSFECALVDFSGRTLWAQQIASGDHALHIALPGTTGSGITFLRIRHGNCEEYHKLVSVSNGLNINSSKTSVHDPVMSAAAASYPTLQFKKADYRDTSFTMTSSSMSNVSVVMSSNSTQICALPTGTLKWESSGILVNIKPDGSHKIVSVKDPTIQIYNGKYLIYCTVYNTSNSTWSMQFIQFTDFAKANDATVYFMDQTSGFSGYKCAPELFYFEPQQLWYLIFQTQAPYYSTTKTPDDPKSWSTPKALNSTAWTGNPVKGQYGAIDYFPIADSTNFYLFMTGDDGSVYRSKTTLEKFPSGLSTPVVVKTLGTDVIFEGGSHYKVKGTANTYLHVIEGQGSTGRYFSAWTSEGIEGAWKDYKVGQSNPLIRSNNVTYASGVDDWTDDVSHGEFIRDNPNQIQELDPCNLQFLYQGKSPSSGGEYNTLPYRLGLVTLKK